MSTTENEAREYSISGSFLWMLFLTIGLELFMGGLLSAGCWLLFQGEVSETSPGFLAALTVMTATLIPPFIKVAAYQSNRPFPFQFLAIKPVSARSVTLAVLLGVVYCLFERAGLLANAVEHTRIYVGGSGADR